MNDCERTFHLLPELRAGRLSPADRSEVLRHLASCEACRDLLDLHAELEAVGRAIPEPAGEELAAMRRRVQARLAAAAGAQAGEAPRAAGPRPISTARGLGWGRRAGLAAAAVLLAAGGFAAGRLAAPPRPDAAALILEQLARRGEGVPPGAAPVAFQNVAMRLGSGGEVTLAFDVATHLEVTRPLDHPLVAELLVEALLDPASSASRLRAVSLAGALPDPAVREALLAAMLHDPNLGVRLKAQEVLAREPADAELLEAFFEVLRHEESVQMRLMAIDYLGGARVAPEALRQAVAESPAPERPALLLRVARLADS